MSFGAQHGFGVIHHGAHQNIYFLFINHDENVNEDGKNFFFKGCHGIILTIENLKHFFPEKCSMGKQNQKDLIWG